jgi:uncharacterized protein YndB with AHSA1/START domain
MIEVQPMSCGSLIAVEPVTITRRLDLDTSAEALWDLIADSDHLAVWLGDSVQIDVRPGGSGTVADADRVRHVLVERVEQHRGLAFTWWDAGDRTTQSRVTFEIESSPDGRSRLTINETFVARSAADIEAARLGWEVRVLSLWACTVAAALVQ